MRIETLADLRGGQVTLFGDFSATIEIYKRIAASGGVLASWIGTWINPQGVHVDLFDTVRTLKGAVHEAIIQIMYLWQDHVANKGTQDDLDQLIEFDREVTRALGLTEQAIIALHERVKSRTAQASPSGNGVPC
jgi:hypothetical protein